MSGDNVKALSDPDTMPRTPTLPRLDAAAHICQMKITVDLKLFEVSAGILGYKLHSIRSVEFEP
jgi:hypothetical protein